MITTVTLNPAIDKIVEINNMALGQVHRVSKKVVSLGGKSINVARILSGLGSETKAICFAGEHNYEEISDYAKKDNIQLETILVKGLTRTNVKVVEPDQNYRTTDINEQGFTISNEKLQEMVELIYSWGTKSDYLVLSGSLPKGVPKSFYKDIAIKLKDITNVIIDADGEILMAGIEGAPFLIKPNIDELESALNKKLDSNEAIVKSCQELIEQFKMNYILVSMGADGSILVGKDINLRADVLPVQVLSTVGAGDSMLAGFIYGLTKFDKSEEETKLLKALSYGVASSSIAISTQDHKAIAETELIAFATDVKINKIVI